MTREEAMALVGTTRIMPVTLTSRFKRPVPGTGGTHHKCLRVSGNCSIGEDGFTESYGHAWITAYEPGQEMWVSVSDFSGWEIVPPIA